MAKTKGGRGLQDFPTPNAATGFSTTKPTGRRLSQARFLQPIGSRTVKVARDEAWDGAANGYNPPRLRRES